MRFRKAIAGLVLGASLGMVSCFISTDDDDSEECLDACNDAHATCIDTCTDDSCRSACSAARSTCIDDC